MSIIEEFCNNAKGIYKNLMYKYLKLIKCNNIRGFFVDTKKNSS